MTVAYRNVSCQAPEGVGESAATRVCSKIRDFMREENITGTWMLRVEGE